MSSAASGKPCEGLGEIPSPLIFTDLSLTPNKRRDFRNLRKAKIHPWFVILNAVKNLPDCGLGSFAQDDNWRLISKNNTWYVILNAVKNLLDRDPRFFALLRMTTGR